MATHEQRKAGDPVKTKLEWRQLTRNCWVAYLGKHNQCSIEVNRNRSWKSLNDDKPFKITVFGKQFGYGGYADLDEAKRGAVLHAKSIVRDLAAWAKTRTP